MARHTSTGASGTSRSDNPTNPYPSSGTSTRPAVHHQQPLTVGPVVGVISWAQSADSEPGARARLAWSDWRASSPPGHTWRRDTATRATAHVMEGVLSLEDPGHMGRYQCVLDELLRVIRTEFPDVTLAPFGSCVQGTTTLNSDLDVSLQGYVPYEWYVPKSAFSSKKLVLDGDRCSLDQTEKNVRNNLHKELLKHIVKMLRKKRYKIRIQEVIYHARVPILKLVHVPSGIPVDLSVGRRTFVKGAIMRRVFDIDPRVRPFMMAVKKWAAAMRINDASQRTLNTFSLNLLACLHLQRRPQPILPAFKDILLYDEELAPEDRPDLLPDDLPMDRASEVVRIAEARIAAFISHRDREHGNSETLPELMESFLVEMAVVLAHSTQYAADVWSGTWLSRREGTRLGFNWQNLGVLDPFEKGENAARAVTSSSRVSIVGALVRSVNYLAGQGSDWSYATWITLVEPEQGITQLPMVQGIVVEKPTTKPITPELATNQEGKLRMPSIPATSSLDSHSGSTSLYTASRGGKALSNVDLLGKIFLQAHGMGSDTDDPILSEDDFMKIAMICLDDTYSPTHMDEGLTFDSDDLHRGSWLAPPATTAGNKGAPTSQAKKKEKKEKREKKDVRKTMVTRDVKESTEKVTSNPEADDEKGPGLPPSRELQERQRVPREAKQKADPETSHQAKSKSTSKSTATATTTAATISSTSSAPNPIRVLKRGEIPPPPVSTSIAGSKPMSTPSSTATARGGKVNPTSSRTPARPPPASSKNIPPSGVAHIPNPKMIITGSTHHPTAADDAHPPPSLPPHKPSPFTTITTRSPRIRKTRARTLSRSSRTQSADRCDTASAPSSFPPFLFPYLLPFPRPPISPSPFPRPPISPSPFPPTRPISCTLTPGDHGRRLDRHVRGEGDL